MISTFVTLQYQGEKRPNVCNNVAMFHPLHTLWRLKRYLQQRNLHRIPSSVPSQHSERWEFRSKTCSNQFYILCYVRTYRHTDPGDPGETPYQHRRWQRRRTEACGNRGRWWCIVVVPAWLSLRSARSGKQDCNRKGEMEFHRQGRRRWQQ